MSLNMKNLKKIEELSYKIMEEQENTKNMTKTNFITKMGIKQKIIILTVLVAFLAMSVSTFVSINNIDSSLMAANRQKTEEITEMVYNLLQGYQNLVDKKMITLAEAQKLAIDNVKEMRYQGKNYIWLNDYNTVMFTHPTLEGKDASNVADPNGLRFFYEGTELAKKNGTASINYYWTKQGESSSKYYPKVSYFRNFKPWHWIIATGIYVDEVNVIVLHTFLQVIFVNIISLAIIIALVLITIVKDIVSSTSRVTRELDESSKEVAAASSQLDLASQKLAEGSAEQAASIQETSSTLEETESMVQQNKDNTQQAAALAKQSKEYAGKSNIEMQKMMSAMEDLKKSSSEISKIIKVIDEIAFQTNILSLNAAVEAARAGEAGKGFAVVAEEVRNLAQRSAQAAKETTKIIEGNIALSENGVQIAKDVQESISEIDVQSKKVSDLLDEISVATSEQAQGVSQINKAVSQMEIVISSNAQTAEESSSASKALYAQTLNLREIIEKLELIIKGQK